MDQPAATSAASATLSEQGSSLTRCLPEEAAQRSDTHRTGAAELDLAGEDLIELLKRSAMPGPNRPLKSYTRVNLGADFEFP